MNNLKAVTRADDLPPLVLDVGQLTHCEIF